MQTSLPFLRASCGNSIMQRQCIVHNKLGNLQSIITSPRQVHPTNSTQVKLTRRSTHKTDQLCVMHGRLALDQQTIHHTPNQTKQSRRKRRKKKQTMMKIKQTNNHRSDPSEHLTTPFSPSQQCKSDWIGNRLKSP